MRSVSLRKRAWVPLPAPGGPSSSTIWRGAGPAVTVGLSSSRSLSGGGSGDGARGSWGNWSRLELAGASRARSIVRTETGDELVDRDGRQGHDPDGANRGQDRRDRGDGQVVGRLDDVAEIVRPSTAHWLTTWTP